MDEHIFDTLICEIRNYGTDLIWILGKAGGKINQAISIAQEQSRATAG